MRAAVIGKDCEHKDKLFKLSYGCKLPATKVAGVKGVQLVLN